MAQDERKEKGRSAPAKEPTVAATEKAKPGRGRAAAAV